MRRWNKQGLSVEEVDGDIDQLSGGHFHGGHFEFGVGKRHSCLDDPQGPSALLLALSRCVDRRQVQTNIRTPERTSTLHTSDVISNV